MTKGLTVTGVSLACEPIVPGSTNKFDTSQRNEYEHFQVGSYLVQRSQEHSLKWVIKDNRSICPLCQTTLAVGNGDAKIGRMVKGCTNKVKRDMSKCDGLVHWLPDTHEILYCVACTQIFSRLKEEQVDEVVTQPVAEIPALVS